MQLRRGALTAEQPANFPGSTAPTQKSAGWYSSKVEFRKIFKHHCGLNFDHIGLA